MELQVFFSPKNRSPLYTIERLQECLKTLLKQGVIEDYSLEILVHTQPPENIVLEMEEEAGEHPVGKD